MRSPAAGQSGRKPIHIDDENAALTHKQLGSEFVGWLNFQPLYHQIVTQQPDLLDQAVA